MVCEPQSRRKVGAFVNAVWVSHRVPLRFSLSLPLLSLFPFFLFPLPRFVGTCVRACVRVSVEQPLSPTEEWAGSTRELRTAHSSVTCLFSNVMVLMLHSVVCSLVHIQLSKLFASSYLETKENENCAAWKVNRRRRFICDFLLCQNFETVVSNVSGSNLMHCT